MKKIKQTARVLLWLLFLPLMVEAQLPGDYDPNNPPEPQNLFALALQVNIPGAGSVSGAGMYTEGVYRWISAGTNSGYRFLYWKENETIISTSASFNYLMPARSVALTAHWIYDPSVPSEPNVTTPRRRVFFTAEPTGGGYFNYTSYENVAGTNFNCHAYAYSGYVFKGWYAADTLISASSPLNFTVRNHDVQIVGKFSFEPGNPGEPNPGTGALVYMATMTQLIEKNKTTAFPVHLVNQNANITSLSFSIAFPQGINVDYSNSILSSRQNGHIMDIADLGNNTYSFSITAPAAEDYFSGTSGVVVTIPVLLIEDWEPGSAHAVEITESSAWTGTNQYAIPRKNGSLVMQGYVSSLYASFFPDVFLNRAYFSNLSSVDAESYLWKFGDGKTSTEKNPLHIYDESGTYQVMLKVTRGELSDSVWQTIQIAEKSQWKVGGNFNLSKQRTGARNFRNLLELFSLFSQSAIISDLRIITEQAELFEFEQNDVNNVIIEALNNQLYAANFKLLFQMDGLGTFPTIAFNGDFGQEHVGYLLRLWQRIELSGVDLQMLGKKLNLQALNTMREQYVCSGTPSVEINFTEISDEINFNWNISLTSQPVSTGFYESGQNTIPPMTLENSSSEIDKITYELYGDFGENRNYWLLDYTYHVRPLLSGQVTNLTPNGGVMQQSVSVQFGWSAIADAVYDLYVWELGTEMNQTPLLAGLTSNSVNNSSYCKYGKTYLWKVNARGPCNSIESHVDTFRIRTLPDLQPISINYPAELYAGDPIQVEVTIRNNGGNPGSMWMNNELMLSRNEQLDGLKSLINQSFWIAIETDSTVVIRFDVVLPADTVSYTRFVVKIDGGNHVMESNEGNNILMSNHINIIQPQIDEFDYNILVDFYRTNAGSYWTRKWRTSSSILIAENWPGVTFYRGRVREITLTNNGITGTLPTALFRLPELKVLNLEGNSITGNLGIFADTMLVPVNFADSLQRLLLQQNNLTGEISNFAALFRNLTHLNLSRNSMLTLSKPLPENITNLTLQYIEQPGDSVVLSQTPEIRLTSLMSYNHQLRDFSHKPSFNLFYQNSHVGYFWFTGGVYRMHWYAADGWNIPSGAVLNIQQTSGLAHGTTAPLKITFVHGDANVDQAVNVLDVQHTLNHVLRENPKPFNFRAADTYPDNSMTVQDIVATINIILDEETNPEPTGAPSKVPADESFRNKLTFDGSYLTLDADDEIAALDLTLKNVKANQLRMLLNNNHYQMVAQNKADGVRLIIFSPTGNTLSTGITALIEATVLSPELLAASASDRQANPIPCRVVQSPAGTDHLHSAMAFALYRHDEIIVRSAARIGSLKLYNMQGMLLMQQISPATEQGVYRMHAANLPEGIYLLRVISTDQSEQTIRLIISK